jgi:hypothetical protein
MQKYFKFSFKKDAEIILVFLAICKRKKKENIYIFYFLGFVWQKPFFFL